MENPVSQRPSRFPKGFYPAMWGQWFGFMLDSYDMALVLVMAPILTKIFTSGTGNPVWQYVVIVLTYSITMAGRPLGSAIFGHFGDKIGRRLLLMTTISGVGICSLLAAFLPTYQSIGPLAWFLFALLRLCMGILFGGEYALGHTFVIEFSPSDIRGRVGGFIQSGFPLGYVFGAVVFAIISIILGKSPQLLLTVGWRIAFATGVIPVLATLLIRYFTKESPAFVRAHERGDIEKSPFFSLFKPPSLWTFLQVFLVMCGLFLTDYSVYGFLPEILTRHGKGFDTTTFAWIYGFALFLSFLGYNFYGWLSDYVGRRKLTLIYCFILVIVGIPTFFVLHNAVMAKDLRMAVVGTVLAAMCKLAWGMLPAYLSERFPTKRRAVGLGFGYSSGALIGAWFSIYVWWAHKIPFIKGIEGNELWLSPAVILVIGAVLTFIGMYLGPETNGISLDDVK
jgi:MFS family permease